MSRYQTIARGGPYYRVCKPDWIDPSDTSFSKRRGGRWNPPGEFGALYLCADRAVAAAYARTWHRGRAIALFSLRPERRPRLQQFRIRKSDFVDVVTRDGVAAVGLPPDYPRNVGWEPCQAIARDAFVDQMPGIASRSAAGLLDLQPSGEELAVFDSAQKPAKVGLPIEFGEWYPDPMPALPLTRRSPRRG